MRVGFIGAGNIATAVASGLVKCSDIKSEDVFLYDVANSKCEALRDKIGISVAADLPSLVHDCGCLVLAVKPQVYESVLSQLREYITPDKLIVSVAAGIRTDYILSRLGQNLAIVRTMPNTPLLIGEGATALSRNAYVSDEQFDFVCKMFECSGSIAVLDESSMNAVISVNGSSPAYVFRFAAAVIDNAVRQGIDAEVAKNLFVQTLIGSAQMINQSGMDIQSLIDMVTSPGGTTFKALEQLDLRGFDECIDAAMLACTRRAEELGRS